jgi:autotransporter-associated beta strand protein
MNKYLWIAVSSSVFLSSSLMGEDGSPIGNTNGGANSVGLKKLGASKLTLAGVSAHTGPTRFEAGTLAVDASGSITNGISVLVANGAMLDITAFGITGYNIGPSQSLLADGMVAGDLNISGSVSGTGTLAGRVTALLNSSLVPGKSAGILTVDGDVELNSGSQLVMELGTTAPGASDTVAGTTGNVTLGGSLSLSLLGTFANNVGEVFTLLLDEGGTSISDLFNNVTALTATTGTYMPPDGHDVTAPLTAVPEPAAGLALLGGLAVLLTGQRRRSW